MSYLQKDLGTIMNRRKIDEDEKQTECHPKHENDIILTSENKGVSQALTRIHLELEQALLKRIQIFTSKFL